MTAARIAHLLRNRGAGSILLAPKGSPLEAESYRLSLPFAPSEPRIKYGDLGTVFTMGRIASREGLDALMFFRSQDIHLGALVRVLYPRLGVVFYQQMQSGIAKTDAIHDFIYRRISAWLTLTGIMRDEVLRWTNVDPAKVHVVPLGRDGNQLSPGNPSRAEARRSLGLPQGGFVVGTLGRLDRQKGQAELLRAMVDVRQKIPGSRLIMAGDETVGVTGFRAGLENLIKDLGLAGVAELRPPTNNVPRFLAALDLFVMPSYSETYGLVLLEAMAMGIPVIATNSGGVPEIVQDGKTGLLVEPKDIGQLSGAIIHLAKDRSLRRDLGIAGRRRFELWYDERKCIDAMVDRLDRLERPSL